MHVILGTPGRTVDMIQRRFLQIQDLKLLCLVGAEEMVHQGFADQLQELFTLVPERLQTCVFAQSAPVDFQDLVRRILRSPVRVLAQRPKSPPLRMISVELAREEDKLDQLCAVLARSIWAPAVLFCRTPAKTEWLAAEMAARGYDAQYLHQGMDHDARCAALVNFNTGKVRMLALTDRAVGRGGELHGVLFGASFDVPPRGNELVLRTVLLRNQTHTVFVTPQDRDVLFSLKKKSYRVSIVGLPEDVPAEFFAVPPAPGWRWDDPAPPGPEPCCPFIF